VRPFTDQNDIMRKPSPKFQSGRLTNRCPLLAQSGRHTNTTGSEPASFQTPLIARNVFGAHFRQTELSFLKFPADKDEALLFGVAQSFQTCAFRR